MTQNLARNLHLFRGLKEKYKNFTSDLWVITNSEIEPQRLHALGVISFRWNTSEQLLFSLFADLLNCPEREVLILGHELGDIALMSRIRVLSVTRHEGDIELLGAIINALEVYEVGRQNRNQVTHFSVQLQLGKERSGVAWDIMRKSKKPEQRMPMPFDNSLSDLRRVAKEIRRLNVSLKAICRRVVAKRDPKRAAEVSSPKTLPVPATLWKPPPQVPKERQPPP